MGTIDRESTCPFCQIVAGKREAKIIFQDETLVVFEDIHPHAPLHLLIVPKKHIRSINDLTEEDEGLVAAMIMRARDVAKEVSVDRSGYKLLFNVEKGAGQVIFHLHMHLTGGWR
jgi:histidine triad (HIT) family protein